jgi:hypothetical protein
MVKVTVLNGSIAVKGYDGQEVLIEANQRGVQISESENEVRVQPSPTSPVDLRLSVPAKTSLQLKCTNGGNIQVEGVEGEIEANGINASVTLRQISGVVLAHSLQGRVLVQMNKVTAGKPMSFSALNGDVDVTLPADLKADVKLQTTTGTIHSDFPITLRGETGMRIGEKLTGTINGGGPELQLTTLNGSLYLRKAKAGSQ